MTFVYAAFIPFLLLSLIYVVLRILFPEQYRAIGMTILAVSGVTMVLVSLGFAGFDYHVEVNGVLQVLSGLWKGLCEVIHMLFTEIKEADIAAITITVVLLMDAAVMALAGVLAYDKSTEENALRWFGVKLAVVLGIWVCILLLEAFLLIPIALVVGAIHLFSSGEIGSIIGAILVIICICGVLGGTTYTVTVRITKN